MLADQLKSAAQKIRRADYHISSFNKVFADFIASQLVGLFVERDGNTGDKLAKLKLASAIPEDLPLIVGDALSNLRASLDHVAGALARLKDTNRSGVYFPFAGDMHDFLLKPTQSKIDAFPAEARPIIESLKPYRGGNDLLWAISRVRNQDCHNFLVPVGAIGQLSELSYYEIEGSVIISDVPSRLDLGIVLANLGQDGTISPLEEARIRYRTDIVFGDVPIVEGKVVSHTLQDMRDITMAICEQFSTTLFF